MIWWLARRYISLSTELEETPNADERIQRKPCDSRFVRPAQQGPASTYWDFASAASSSQHPPLARDRLTAEEEAALIAQRPLTKFGP